MCMYDDAHDYSTHTILVCSAADTLAVAAGSRCNFRVRFAVIVFARAPIEVGPTNDHITCIYSSRKKGLACTP